MRRQPGRNHLPELRGVVLNLTTRTIRGHCPSCGQRSLFLGLDGHVTCSTVECDQPDAVDQLLADHETEHLVVVRHGTAIVRHPLRERIDGQLEDCELQEYLNEHRPPLAAGRYRAVLDRQGTWRFGPIFGEAAA